MKKAKDTPEGGGVEKERVNKTKKNGEKEMRTGRIQSIFWEESLFQGDILLKRAVIPRERNEVHESCERQTMPRFSPKGWKGPNIWSLADCGIDNKRDT